MGRSFSIDLTNMADFAIMRNLKATQYYDWPPFSHEYESVDCNVRKIAITQKVEQLHV